MDEIRNPRRTIAILVVLAFLAGGGAGALVAARIAQASGGEPRPHRDHDRDHGPKGEKGEKGPERVIARMTRGLGLDAETEKKVRAVFAARRPQFQAIFDKFRPEMEKLRKETNAEVRAVLPPEKQAAFDRMIAEEDARH